MVALPLGGEDVGDAVVVGEGVRESGEGAAGFLEHRLRGLQRRCGADLVGDR